MDETDAVDGAESRRATREQLLAVTTSLIAEFAGLLPAGTVIRCVARTQEQLRRAGVRAELAVVAEASARHRLSRLVPAHGSAG